MLGWINGGCHLRKKLNLIWSFIFLFKISEAAVIKNPEVRFTTLGSPSFLKITGEATKLDYQLITEKMVRGMRSLSFLLKNFQQG